MYMGIWRYIYYSATFSRTVHVYTSLSIKPIRWITYIGGANLILSILGIVWAIWNNVLNKTVSGWASIICIICFMSGIQMVSLGIIGEYIGKIYLEVKRRPRYCVKEYTYK